MASRLTFALALAWLALGAAMTMAFVRFPSGLDELQHLSFVRWMELHPQLFPSYDAMPVLTPDLTHWRGVTRLSHPSPYYLLLAPLDAATHSIEILRLANLAFALTGVALMLLAGFRVLAEPGQRMVFAATVALFPKLAIVGGLVINDNLAVLVAGLGFLALVRWQARPGDVALPIALAAAGWTKLTLAVMLGGAFVILELIERRRLMRAHLSVGIALAAASLPYLVNVLRYGAPVFPDMGVYVAPSARQAISLPQYVGIFGQDLGQSWAALEPSNPVASGGLVLIVALAAVACAVTWKRQPVAAALVLATIPALALHLWFGWRLYETEGYVHAAQSRYYYGVWPGVALAVAQLWGGEKPGVVRTGLTTAVFAGLVTASAPFCIALAVLHGVTPR